MTSQKTQEQINAWVMDGCESAICFHFKLQLFCSPAKDPTRSQIISGYPLVLPQKAVIFIFIFLIFNKFVHFNWRLITLQYCSGFAIHWHKSATGVHVFPILKPLPPPSPSHPSGSSQCTSPEHPVSCIEPGLVIRFTYDNIHVSMPFSQIIPPLPSPTESNRLFYTSVSLLLSHI